MTKLEPNKHDFLREGTLVLKTCFVDINGTKQGNVIIMSHIGNFQKCVVTK